jgi:selenide,water dikinase
VIPGGTYNNLDFVKPFVDFGNLSRTQQLLLCDAQTSGGLLVALPEKDATRYLNTLQEAGIKEAGAIGKFVIKGKGTIRIKP